MTTLREQVAELSPPWLRDEVGGSILRAAATVLDALVERTRQAVRLRFPEAGSFTAFGYLGNDRAIERGPAQTRAGYAVQLRRALDTWRNAGGARTVLSQLAARFAPATPPPMRVVHDVPASAVDAAVWHELDTFSGDVSKAVVSPCNWDWDGQRRWWWGWVIVDGLGLWEPDYWDEIGTWDDGGVWDSNMTAEDADALNAISAKWKPANVYSRVIVTFALHMFTNEDPSAATEPEGRGEDDSWRLTIPASFFCPQGA